jgi:hypothetical protein
MESKTLKAKPMESYIPKTQELTINVLEVKPVKLPFIIVKSNTPGILESTINTLKALLANVIETSLVKLTSILLKL